MNFEEILNNIGAWLSTFVMTFGVRIIGAILVLVIGFKVVKLLLKLLRKTDKFAKIDPGAETFIFSTLSFLLKAVVALTAIAILGVPMTNFVAVLGSIGLAIGLALQGSLSNFAGGLMILIFHPFTVGNFITAAGVSGTVKEISILYTILDTPDNIRIVVPNGQLSNAVVSNVSYHDTRRVDFKFGVSYKSDLKQVISLLQGMASQDERVLKDKDIFTKISSYDESQITITMRVWVNSGDYWAVFFDFTEKAKELFDENGIEIPFPQLDVHVTSDND